MANYLLDTQVFIWSNQDHQKLTPNFIKILSNPKYQFYLSIASVWEMQIKIQLGKLTVEPTLQQALSIARQKNLYQILPITETHILNLQKLDFIHKDPFDRLLISQAITENLTLLTVDEHIVQYPVEFIN